MSLRYCISFLLLTLACNNLISSDEHNKLMERSRTLYQKSRSIDDLITPEDIDVILPYVIKQRKRFIDTYNEKLSESQEDKERWNSKAWLYVRTKLWKNIITMNFLILHYFGYKESSEFEFDSYEQSTELFTEFFKEKLYKYAHNNLVKEFMKTNTEITRIQQEIDGINTLRNFINENKKIQSYFLEYSFTKPPKDEILWLLKSIEIYQNDLNKSTSPLVHAEMKKQEYLDTVKTLKNIRDSITKMKEPEKSAVKETISMPTKIQPATQQTVTIQTPASTSQQKPQSYWDIFRGYMAHLFGL